MKELKEELNWFSKWEEQLPSPDELMPLTQTLIPPHLLLAFDLPTQFTPNPPLPHKITQTPDFDSSDLGSGDDPARTLKRPRLVWTPQLHKRFVDAVAHLGIKNAVPKTIMQLMSVDGLTRENVASHLQKYRLYLKRMQQGHSAGDSATDHLFASSPVPPHFLRPNSDQFLPFVPVAALQQQHHHQQMAAAAGHLQYGQMGHLVVPVNGQFEHPFLARQQPQHQLHRMGTPLHKIVPSSYAEDLEPATPAANGRKALTLFPTGDN